MTGEPWHTFPHHHIAERVCTPKQLRTLRLRWQGLTITQIAATEHCSRSSIRDRLEAAILRIRRDHTYQEPT